MPITSLLLGTVQGKLLITIAMIVGGISYWAYRHPDTAQGLLDIFNFGSPSQRSLFGESDSSWNWLLILAILPFLIAGVLGLSWHIQETQYEKEQKAFKVDMEWNDEVAPTETPIPDKKQSASQDKGTTLSKEQEVNKGTNE